MQWHFINLVLSFSPGLPTDVDEVPGLRGFVGLSLGWLEVPDKSICCSEVDAIPS